MNPIARYMKENNLNDEDFSKVISDKLGRPISSKGVAQIKNRSTAPIPWLNALGISPSEPSGLKDVPTPTGNVPEAFGLPFEIRTAKATIAFMYGTAGKGVAMASRTPAVATIWDNSAEGIADAWIEWAKTNKTVANGIAMLTVGGPGGQVIMLNATLIISSLMAINQQRQIQLVPPDFRPPHEQPMGNEEKIQENTDAAVDHALGFPPNSAQTG